MEKSAKSSNIVFFTEALKYPLVIKQVGADLVISAPDFGLYETVALTAKNNLSNSNINFEFDSETQKNLNQKIASLWLQIQNHLNEKKWIPDPSSFKQSLQQGEEDYSLPEFTQKLQQHINISENTVRREIKRGRIRCYQTEGGHRRIPASELKSYIELSTVKKNTLDSETPGIIEKEISS